MDKDTLKILDEFYAFKVGRRTKVRSAKNYINNLKQFFTWVNKPIHDVTESDIDNYIIHLKVNVKNSVNTQKLKQAAIRLFYAWYARRYQAKNPAEMLVPLQEEVKIPVMPTPDEFTRMVYACNVKKFQGRRDAALLCILADTGIRSSEASALNVGSIQVDKENYLCIVPRIKSWERMVPFGKLTKGALVGEFFTAYYMEIKYTLRWRHDEPLFKQMGLMYKGGRLQPDGIYHIVRKYAKKAGIDRIITPHSFRHFFGTYSIINGTDIRELKKLMGHAWMETTERYVHIAETIQAKTLEHRGTTSLQSPGSWTGFVDAIKKAQTGQ